VSISAVNKCTGDTTQRLDEKKKACSVTNSIFQEEGCGICEKKGAEVFWFSPYSRSAHAKCFEKIQAAERPAVSLVEHMFQYVKEKEEPALRDGLVFNTAHIELIKRVRGACGAETISSYLEKHGDKELANLFRQAALKVADESLTIIRGLVDKTAEDKGILAALEGISQLCVCGICEKDGATVSWFGPSSRYSHEKCVKNIQALEDLVWPLVKKVFLYVKEEVKSKLPDDSVLNFAHMKLIKNVRSACGTETISSYLEKHGGNELKRLFQKAAEDASEAALATIPHS
jgi:hypothetical protein